MSDWKHGYTDEEIAEAEKLYDIEVKEMYERGYSGDFGLGISFAMATYGPICWRHFFKRDPYEAPPIVSKDEWAKAIRYGVPQSLFHASVPRKVRWKVNEMLGVKDEYPCEAKTLRGKRCRKKAKWLGPNDKWLCNMHYEKASENDPNRLGGAG